MTKNIEKKINEQDTNLIKEKVGNFKSLFSKENYNGLKKKVKKTQETFGKNKFLYQYYDSNNNLQIGEKYAKNKEDLAELLRIDGIKNFKNVVQKKDKDNLLDLEDFLNKLSKPRNEDVFSMVSSVATLLRGGSSLLESLRETKSNVSNKSLNKAVGQIINRLQVDSSAYKAFGKRPDLFSKSFLSLVKSGESSGNLAKAFTELEGQLKLKDKIDKLKREAKTGPLMDFGSLVFALGFILTQIVPGLRSMFDGSGQELPQPTVILLAASDMILNNMSLFISSLIIVVVLLKSFLNNEVSKRFIDGLVLKIPILREKVKFENYYDLAINFDILGRSGGESAKVCLEATLENCKNLIFKDDFEKMVKNYRMGKDNPIGIIVDKNRNLWKTKNYILYPLLKNGEKNSNLGQILYGEKEILFNKFEESTRKMIGILKGIVGILIKLMILFVVIAMFLPIMSFDPS